MDLTEVLSTIDIKRGPGHERGSRRGEIGRECPDLAGRPDAACRDVEDGRTFLSGRNYLAQHARFHHARRDAVCGHTDIRALSGCGLGQCQDRALGRGIGRAPAKTSDMRRDGADRDDAAVLDRFRAAAAQHFSQHQKRTGRIDVECPPPVCKGRVCDAGPMNPVADENARACDEYRYRTESGFHLPEKALGFGFTGNIASERSMRFVLAQIGCRRTSVVDVAVHDREHDPVGSERIADCAAEAASAASAASAAGACGSAASSAAASSAVASAAEAAPTAAAVDAGGGTAMGSAP